MTAQKPRKGMRFIDRSKPYRGEVPIGTKFGKDFDSVGAYAMGSGCTFGDHVYIAATIGNGVTVGDRVRLRGTIGDLVRTGSDIVIDEYCQIANDVVIGNHVHIEKGVEIRQGVVVPDHWLIPTGSVVNPGPNGAPVVVQRIPQPSRCNVEPRRDYY